MLRVRDKHFFYYYVFSECERIEGVLTYIRKNLLGKELPVEFDRGLSLVLDKVVMIRRATEEYKEHVLNFLNADSERYSITDMLYDFNETVAWLETYTPDWFDLDSPYEPNNTHPMIRVFSLAYFKQIGVTSWEILYRNV